MLNYCNVEIKYQDVGTNWLIVLEGSEENIEAVFDSFYNWNCAAKENSLEWLNESKTLAAFWTQPKRLLKYWFNIFINRLSDTERSFFKKSKNIVNGLADEFAKNQINLMDKIEGNFKFGQICSAYIMAGGGR